MIRPKIFFLVAIWLAIVLFLSFRALFVGVERIQSGRTSFNPSLTSARAAGSGLPDVQAPPFAHGAAVAFASSLMGELSEALERGSAADAIRICGDAASRISQQIAEEKGVRVGRVALNLRNPANAPDSWERSWLESALETTGSNPVSPLGEFRSLPDGQKEYAYLMPIYTAPSCLQCHGKPANLGRGVAEALFADYPDDAATGIVLGSLRGAVKVRVPIRETRAGQFK